MNGALYDPINAFCKMALVSLYEAETRIDMRNNIISIQPPTANQAFSRLFRSSRSDMHGLQFPLKRLIELTCVGGEYGFLRGGGLSSKGSSSSSSPSLEPMVSPLPPPPIFENHLFQNEDIRRILRHHLAGMSALQKNYEGDNAESTLQLSIVMVEEAFKLSKDGEDARKAFRLLPPSFQNYQNSIVDQTSIINIWHDDTLKKIADEFELYIENPCHPNMVVRRNNIVKLLAVKDEEYLTMIKQSSK